MISTNFNSMKDFQLVLNRNKIITTVLVIVGLIIASVLITYYAKRTTNEENPCQLQGNNLTKEECIRYICNNPSKFKGKLNQDEFERPFSIIFIIQRVTTNMPKFSGRKYPIALCNIDKQER